MTNKHYFLLAAAVAVAFSACDSEARRRQSEALNLAGQANTCYDNADYETAIALIDSLNRAYPDQVDTRRELIPLRTKALKAYSEESLVRTDSLVTVLQAEIAGFTDVMHHVEGDDDLDGYYVVKDSYNPDLSSFTGIQPRVSDLDYSLYLLASSADKRVGVTQIVLSSPDGQMASTAIPEDSERAGDTDAFGSDIASFRYDEVADLVAWAADHTASINRLTIRGSLGEVDVKPTPAQIAALGTAWRFAQVASKLQAAVRLKDKLERQLVLARDQEINLE